MTDQEILETRDRILETLRTMPGSSFARYPATYRATVEKTIIVLVDALIGTRCAAGGSNHVRV